MDKLAELISLLTCGDLQGEDAQTCAAAVRADMDDPDLAFVEEENDRLQFLIRVQLDDWIAWSDKIDELHDKIIADFQEPLPPFPHHANKMDFSSADYFRWMDSVLAGQGYELLLWRDRFDDNIYAFAVGRDDTARILALCTDIGVYAERATERRRC